ncbi:hypothetical protein [Amantichitinum ursilacus]|nr:hypothetical protein [Amantichitinum ursilacus]
MKDNLHPSCFAEPQGLGKLTDVFFCEGEGMSKYKDLCVALESQEDVWRRYYSAMHGLINSFTTGLVSYLGVQNELYDEGDRKRAVINAKHAETGHSIRSIRQIDEQGFVWFVLDMVVKVGMPDYGTRVFGVKIGLRMHPDCLIATVPLLNRNFKLARTEQDVDWVPLFDATCEAVRFMFTYDPFDPPPLN